MDKLQQRSCILSHTNTDTNNYASDEHMQFLNAVDIYVRMHIRMCIGEYDYGETCPRDYYLLAVLKDVHIGDHINTKITF